MHSGEAETKKPRRRLDWLRLPSRPAWLLLPLLALGAFWLCIQLERSQARTALAATGNVEEALKLISDVIDKADPENRELHARAYNARGTCFLLAAARPPAPKTSS